MKRKAKPPKSRTPVLVVLSADGFLQAYAERGVDVHIGQRLDVPQHCEASADDYLTRTLPKRYRELFYPGKVRAVGLVERVTPEKALDTLWQLEILKGLREMRTEARAAVVPAAIQRRRKAL